MIHKIDDQLIINITNMLLDSHTNTYSCRQITQMVQILNTLEPIETEKASGKK